MISIRLGEFLYYCSFGLLFLAKGVGLEYGQKIFGLCIAVSLGCLAGKVMLTKHTPKELAAMLLLTLWGCLILKSSGETAALAAVLVMIGIKGIPVKRLMKVCLGIWGPAFALSFACGYFRIRDGVVVVHEKLGLGPIIRWSLGYTHPNVLHISYLVLVMLLMYVIKPKGKRLWLYTALLFVGNLWVFLWSVSYTGVLLVFGYLLLNLYLQMRRRLTIAERILLQCVLPFCAAFPLAGPFLLKGSAFAFFNDLLSTRFEQVYNFFHEFSVSWFGTRAHYENTVAKLTLDSSFAYLLMYYGILAFGAFCLGYFFLIWRLGREDRRGELALTVSVVTAGITEQFLFNLSFKNLTFFFLGEYFYEVLSRGNPKKKWNRELSLLSGLDRGIRLPGIKKGTEEIRGFFRKHWVKITAVMAVGMILCGGFRAMTVKMPDSVYVNRWITDHRDVDSEVFLDLSEVPADFNSLVLGYDGPEVGMYCLKGNIITLEYVRAVAGAAVLGGAAVWLLSFGIGLIQSFQRGKTEAAAGGEKV